MPPVLFLLEVSEGKKQPPGPLLLHAAAADAPVELEQASRMQNAGTAALLGPHRHRHVHGHQRPQSPRGDPGAPQQLHGRDPGRRRTVAGTVDAVPLHAEEAVVIAWVGQVQVMNLVIKWLGGGGGGGGGKWRRRRR